MLSAFALGAYYFFTPWKETFVTAEAQSLSYNFANVYALSTVLFPPYWLPVVGSGVVAYFFYDWARPAQSHFRNVYAVACDLLSCFFLAWWIAMLVDIDWPYPSFTGKMYDESHNDPHHWESALDRYVWSVLIERIKTPLIAVWIALLSMPTRSLTSRVLEWRPLAEVLGPTSYGCFLFHQIICQWYWWITRSPAAQPGEISLAGMYEVYPEAFERPYPPTAFNYTSIKRDYTWWNFPKYYYWFSPLPLPVAWFEFFYVVRPSTSDHCPLALTQSPDPPAPGHPDDALLHGVQRLGQPDHHVVVSQGRRPACPRLLQGRRPDGRATDRRAAGQTRHQGTRRRRLVLRRQQRLGKRGHRVRGFADLRRTDQQLQ